MNPNKVRNLIPSFAMDIGRPVEEVQTVISFYYKTLRQKLTALDSVNVQVENLGKFYIKEKALDSNIEKCNIIVEKLSNNTLKEYSSKVDYQGKIVKMNAMKEKIAEEKERRKEVITKRFGDESKK